MKNYDFKKARKIIAENREFLEEALLGMYEDWFWTAEDVFTNGKIKQAVLNQGTIGGISGSSWATPTLCLRFKDGTEKMLPCYKGESEVDAEERKNMVVGNLGILSGPIQENITPLSEE